MCFQVLRPKDARRCILELFGAKLGLEWLSHNWSQGLDEFEDLKMMIPTWTRFPSWSRKVLTWRRIPNRRRIPNQRRIPNWRWIPNHMRIPRRTRIPTWSRKVKPRFPTLVWFFLIVPKSSSNYEDFLSILGHQIHISCTFWTLAAPPWYFLFLISWF